MAYIVQADVPGNNAASVTIAEREKAFAIARNWIKSGYTCVKVIGDGRIYLPAEFEGGSRCIVITGQKPVWRRRLAFGRRAPLQPIFSKPGRPFFLMA
jgi:hypothetical protein